MASLPEINPDTRADTVMDAPDLKVSARELFGLDTDMMVPAFSEKDERVPDLDPSYVFDPDTTMAILAGFAHNRRVMVQGYHGTGKSTHIEQVAARLNRSEEHTSELQSLMRISYAVFCLKKKKSTSTVINNKTQYE